MAGWGMAAGWPGTPEPSIRDGCVNLEAGEELILSQICVGQTFGHMEAPAQYITGEQILPHPLACT